IPRVFPRRDLNHDVSKRQLLFNHDPQKVAETESTGERDVARDVAQVLHDLADREKPDTHLEESERRSQDLSSSRDADCPNGGDRYYAGLGKEDKRGQQGQMENKRANGEHLLPPRIRSAAGY